MAITLSDPLRARNSGAMPGDETVRQRVLEICQWYIDAGLGDADANRRLASADDAIYWQQLSEVLIANELVQAGLAPSRKPRGPDFLIEHDGQRVWVEVVCPEPKGIPTDWLTQTEGVVSLPHEQIVLRWTSAIKEKLEKLAGQPDRPETGYLAKGVVAPDDGYIIAVNGRLLRNRSPQISGISQYPFAVEVTLAVGPFSIHIDSNTLKTIWSGLQHRRLLQKPNGAMVPADTFFDPGYVQVSGVWAIDFDENVLFGARKRSILAHNHAASNPLPALLLPVESEYRATVRTDEYSVDRVDGRLAIVGRSP